VYAVRIHGRGGQGVVTAAELLSVAAFGEGRHAQAFPTFGSERTGAPVAAFCRIGDRPIRAREPVTEPDAVLVQDATLLHQVAVFAGLREHGCVLINSTRDAGALGLAGLSARLVTVPATDLAQRHLGRPLPNAALLGGFCALSGQVAIASLCAAIRARFSGRVAEGNAAAATAAYEKVRDGLLEAADA